MPAHRAAAVVVATFAVLVGSVRGVEIKERPTRTEHGNRMRQMTMGMDLETIRHHHLWDDDDGILFPRQFKPFHTWVREPVSIPRPLGLAFLPFLVPALHPC